MKYCVMANLSFDTPAKRDTISQVINNFIAGKLIWGATQSLQSIGMEGNPSHNLLIRFENRADMDSLFEIIKDKMLKIPVLKGTVSKHDCPHDENPPKPCEVLLKWVKV